jgi:hypothetical protein
MSGSSSKPRLASSRLARRFAKHALEQVERVGVALFAYDRLNAPAPCPILETSA